MHPIRNVKHLKETTAEATVAAVGPDDVSHGLHHFPHKPPKNKQISRHCWLSQATPQ